MTTWVVSRHAGAVEWLARRGFGQARAARHLDPEAVAPGDCVVGTLPVPLIAAVTARGAAYYHLVIPLPEQWRGRELSAGQLDELGSRLGRYTAYELAAG